jgi:hypothetical protein
MKNLSILLAAAATMDPSAASWAKPTISARLYFNPTRKPKRKPNQFPGKRLRYSKRKNKMRSLFHSKWCHFEFSGKANKNNEIPLSYWAVRFAKGKYKRAARRTFKKERQWKQAGVVAMELKILVNRTRIKPRPMK